MFKNMICSVIHVCGSHMMHSFKRWCDRKEVNDSLRYLLMTSCCRMITSDSYERVKYIFRHICVVTLNESESKSTNFF